MNENFVGGECKQKNSEEAKKCVEPLQGWNVNGGSLWHTVGTKELKLLEGCCHSNLQVLARSKISHIPAGLGLPSSKSGG